MKRIFVAGSVAAALMVLPAASTWAAEHGGKEHGGSSQPPASSSASSTAVNSSDLQALKDAANALNGSQPSLAGKLRDLYRKLGGK